MGGETVNGLAEFIEGGCVKTRNQLLSMAAVGALFLNLLALPAQSGVLTFNPATGGSGANQDQSVGWQFNVVSPITVTDLEWYSPNAAGLNTAHTVGIWSPGGGLLTSALVPAGAAAGLDGMFRFVLVTPVNLAAANGYVVGGENFAANTDRLACGSGGGCDGLLTQTLDPRLAFVNATFSDIGSGFVDPTQFSVAHEGFYGPSFSAAAVPAPIIGQGLLVVLAVGAVLFGRKLLESLNERTISRSP
jgi:hypothetical protein